MAGYAAAEVTGFKGHFRVNFRLEIGWRDSEARRSVLETVWRLQEKEQCEGLL